MQGSLLHAQSLQCSTFDQQRFSSSPLWILWSEGETYAERLKKVEETKKRKTCNVSSLFAAASSRRAEQLNVHTHNRSLVVRRSSMDIMDETCIWHQNYLSPKTVVLSYLTERGLCGKRTPRPHGQSVPVPHSCGSGVPSWRCGWGKESGAE